MTKTELIAAVAEEADMPKSTVSAFMTALSEVVEECVQDKEPINFGFAKLTYADRASRMGRNPKTGDAIKIPARTVVKIKPSSVLAVGA